MAIKTADQMLTNWRNGVVAKQANYASGVAQSSDWAAAATTPQAVSARNTGLQAAIAAGTIERGIQNYGTAKWRNTTQAKAGNWVQGVQSQVAQQNASAGFNRLHGYLTTAQNAIANTPRGGFQENIQRMVAHATSIHNSAQADKGY